MVLPQPSGNRESGGRTGWGTRGGRVGSDAREGGHRNKKEGRQTKFRSNVKIQTHVSDVCL